jgi:uncharacterized protein YkwD
MARPFRAIVVGSALALVLVQGVAVAKQKAVRTPAVRPPAARVCPSSQAIPNRANLVRIRAAVLCLVNQERERHHLRPLRIRRPLRTVAIRHANDMVRRHYFGHVTRAGATLDTRLVRLGYRGGTTIAENLAWGAGGHSTPLTIFAGWMSSARHRANILSRRFRTSGIGVAVGTPQRLPRGQLGATYTHAFASSG